jgi:hypothetical protein
MITHTLAQIKSRHEIIEYFTPQDDWGAKYGPGLATMQRMRATASFRMADGRVVLMGGATA